MDSVEKEMSAVNVAFKFLDDDYIIPPGYTEVNGSHLIFTIKMEDFRRKSHYVAVGHTVSPAPAILTYASVVSRETVWIALTLAAQFPSHLKHRKLHFVDTVVSANTEFATKSIVVLPLQFKLIHVVYRYRIYLVAKHLHGLKNCTLLENSFYKLGRCSIGNAMVNFNVVVDHQVSSGGQA